MRNNRYQFLDFGQEIVILNGLGDGVVNIPSPYLNFSSPLNAFEPHLADDINRITIMY